MHGRLNVKCKTLGWWVWLRLKSPLSYFRNMCGRCNIRIHVLSLTHSFIRFNALLAVCCKLVWSCHARTETHSYSHVTTYVDVCVQRTLYLTEICSGRIWKKRKNCSRDTGVDGSLTSRMNLDTSCMKVWAGFSRSGWRPVAYFLWTR